MPRLNLPRLNLSNLALVAAAVALVPAAARACPTALGAGIVYTSDDDSTTTVTPTDRTDVLREVVRLADDDGYELQSLHGLFELTTADVDATGVIEETRETSTYADPPALPEPGTIQQGIIAQVTNASESYTRRHDVQAGPLAEVSLGDCTYQGYPIELRVFQPDAPMIHQFIRVPALGITFYTGFQDQDGSETYRITSVSPLPGVAPTK